ncbi:hypothetical protein [Chitinimonas sp.]|uniref:hypothetical protein n=1 Tax=Chitinimonas sp. TaxID=1934313 RepID=UPI002F93CA1C
MFERIFPAIQQDTPNKALRNVLDQLPGQPMINALDALYVALRESLAVSPSGPAARKLIDAIAPTAWEWAERAMAELAKDEDKPVRRDLIGKRLALLADQLSNACYIEAVRESVQLQRGSGRVAGLSDWAAGHFRWLGLAHTARALLDPRRAHLQWESLVSLYLALVRHGALPVGMLAAESEPALSLAYLLLSHDAFGTVLASEVAVTARACWELAPQVRLAADFHRDTPLVMDVEADESCRIVGWAGPSPETPALCYGLAAAADKALALQAEWRDGKPIPWLVAAGLPTDLLERIAQSWVGRRGRCPNPAVIRHSDARIAFDFLRIRGLLGQKGDRVPSNDPYLFNATIIDIDEFGVSMALPAETSSLLVSGLLALNIGNRGWWLARPARGEPEPDGSLFVAARWLGQQAESVRLAPSQWEALRALYIHPSSNNGYNTCIVLDRGDLAEVPCLADLAAGSQTIVPGKPDQIGPMLWRYSCKPA